jgi:hypothetical protein
VSRIAQIFLALSGIALTAAVTLTYTPSPPDLRPLWALGGVFLLLALVVDARPAFVTKRVPGLRPSAYHIAEVIRDGDRLRSRLETEFERTPPPERKETAAREIEEWMTRASAIVQKYAGAYLTYFETKESESSRYIGMPDWASSLLIYIDQRLKRLSAILLRIS